MIFTDEHIELGESMTRWVKDELYPNRLEYEKNYWPSEALKRAGDLGFLGLCYPEEIGGQGGDYYYSLVRAEALSHSWSGGLAMGFAVHTDMVTPPIELLGSKEQQEEYLRPSITGEKIGCLGITEPDAGSDVAGIKTTAKDTGEGFLLNGTKVFITNGLRAHYCLLVAKTEEDANPHQSQSLLLVDLRDADGNLLEGITASAIEKMGMKASDTAELNFSDVFVPYDKLVGTRGQGFYHISWELQGERLVGAVGSVASAERMFEKTLDYAKERQAFGRPIGKFQTIRHQMAMMSAEIEAVKQLCYTTAYKFKNDQYPVKEISQAKLLAAQLVFNVADQCLQIHGGWGYTEEYEIERAFRDARLNRIGAGTDEIMLEVIGRLYGL